MDVGCEKYEIFEKFLEPSRTFGSFSLVWELISPGCVVNPDPQFSADVEVFDGQGWSVAPPVCPGGGKEVAPAS